jgi:hypothetical protein
LEKAIQKSMTLHRAGLYPLVAPPSQCGCRTRFVSDSLVSAPKHQHLHELLEDHSIGYAMPMTAERMIDLRSRQQRRELLPDGFDDVCWDSGHERVPSLGSFDNSPNDRTSRTQFSCVTDPLLAEALSPAYPYRRNAHFTRERSTARSGQLGE